ncbi:MAG: TonB family protein [Polaromonas sp.]|nr:TonB family protein [Polaromonas sp.]
MTATAFSSSRAAPPPAPRISRNALIALIVVGLHVGFIWALQSGLLVRAAEIIIPAEILTRFVDPPAPKVEPVKPTPAPVPVPVKKTVTPRAPVQPAPQPLAIADPTPTPNAPTGVLTPPAPPAPPAPVAAAPAAPPAPPAPPVVQLPSTDADYLQNPKPAYPSISRRLGEQGKTIVRVLIGTDGLPQRGEIGKSSGFDRLDQAAMASVMRWRFVPGKRNGVAEAMWFNVPVNWVLE